MTLSRRKFLGVVGGFLGLSMVPLGFPKIWGEEGIVSVQLVGTRSASTVVPWDFVLSSVEGPEDTIVKIRNRIGETGSKALKGDTLTIQLRKDPFSPVSVILRGRKV